MDMQNIEKKPKVESLIITQLPNRLDYYVGETNIDPAGGTICAIMDDGSFHTIPMEDDNVTIKANSSESGNALAEIQYNGCVTMYQISFRNPIVRKFHVKQPPKKRKYLSGELLDLDGLVLEAEYETGERVLWNNVPEIEHRVKQGEAVYPLSIENITVPIFISVSASKLRGIRMGALPTKTSYLERKEQFDVSGATVIHEYDNGVEEEVPLGIEMLRGFSNLNIGPQTISVQVGPFTTSFEITIEQKKASKITVVTNPYKLNYIEGEDIDMTGLSLSVQYDNDETFIVEKFDFLPQVASMEEMAVRVIIDEAAVEIPIGVSPRQMVAIEMAQLPHKLIYLERGEDIDVTGAAILCKYNYGEPEEIPVTRDMIHGFDNRRVGSHSAEVQFNGFIASFDVEISPQQLMGLMVSQGPNKTHYVEGERFDKTGMVISGFYNNGILQPIQSYTIMPDNPLKEGDVAIVVVVMDKSVVVPIRVEKMTEEPILLPLPSEWLPPAVERDADAEISKDTVTESTGVVDNDRTSKDQRNANGKRRTGVFGKIPFYPSTSRLRDLRDD